MPIFSVPLRSSLALYSVSSCISSQSLQHQPAQSAYRWGSISHWYLWADGYTTGRAYRKSSEGWEAQHFRGCGDVREMGPSYFVLRPQHLAESSSSHVVVFGRRCLSKSLKSVNRCVVINKSVLNKRSKTGWCKGIHFSSLTIKLCFVSNIVPFIALRLCLRETMLPYDDSRSENVYFWAVVFLTLIRIVHV
jgi:hypothetical protein